MKNDNIVAWLIRFVKGLFIGSGFILPGLSGGVLAAVFGLYERMIEFFANIKSNFKGNFFFFLPVGIGGIFGIFLFSVLLSVFLDRAEVPLMWFFIGCIGGTMPQLWQQAGARGRRKFHIAVLIISTILAFAFLIFIDRAVFNEFPETIYTWAFAGGLVGLVATVPGFSAAVLLYFFGILEPMIAGIAAFDFRVILPLFIGAVVAVLAFSKLMSRILAKAYGGFFHVIIGLVIASTILIIPRDLEFYTLVNSLICVGSAALGVVLVRLICGMDKRMVKP